MLESIDRFWMNVRTFLFRRHNLSDIFFVSLYSLFQLLLIIFIRLQKDNIDLVVSLFVVVLMLTIAVERIMMSMRYNDSLNAVNNEKNMIYQDKRIIEMEYNQLITQNKILTDKINNRIGRGKSS